jgi:DNA-binding CsgD family transcriptional regulator
VQEKFDQKVEFLVDRSPRRGPFDGADVRDLKVLLPHLQRVAMLGDRLSQADAQSGSAIYGLELLGAAALLIDADRRVIASTPAGERILQSAGALRVSRERIRATDLEADRNLERALNAATGTGSAGGLGQIVAIRGTDASPATRALILPSPHAMGYFSSRRLAVMLLSQDERIVVDADALKQLYGLTAAEARLVSGLCNGESISDYAERSAISVTTAKSHLRAAFVKVGENRQADLIRRIIANPLVRASSGYDN